VLLLARLGQLEGAARLYGETTREVQIVNVPSLDVEITQLRATMGSTAFDSARATGAALSYQAAADLAMELIHTARAGLATHW
jgi:hypothetical protein